MQYDEILQTVIPIAREAGQIALRHFRKPLAQQIKATAVDIVTEADTKVEAYIASELLRLFPDHHLVGEEGGGQGAPADDAAHFWYVDPIDGTTNFASGIAYFCTSIALTDNQRNPQVGIVYDPNHDDLFTAIAGQGATLNGQPIRVSSTPELVQAVVGSGFPHDKQTNPDNNLRQWEAFVLRARGVRRLGSAALDFASVAAGRLDGFWERGLNPWDALAGLLLVREAGGTVTDYQGHPSPQANGEGRYLATNGHLHPAMLDVLRIAATP